MNFYLSIQKKTRLDNYFPNISMESIFIKTENFKTTEPLKFVLNLSEGLY